MKIILYKQKNYGRFSDSRRKGDVMDINEIAKDTYYFSINNNLSGFITKRNAIKCFEQLAAKLEPGESIHLPFIDTPGSCYYATQHRIIKCSKKLFGFKEWKWDQIKSINYLKRGLTGTLILNTVHGEVKILVCSYKAKFVCDRLNETKKIAK